MRVLERFHWKRLLVQLPPLISALILGIDICLKLKRETGLCTTHACKVVGEYLRWDEFSLIILGASFFCILWLILFIACRYDKKWLWTTILLLLSGSLAFDGGLLGFQFMTIKEYCALCIAVGIALFVCLVSTALFRRSIGIALIGIAVWTGAFAANSILKYVPKIPKLSDGAVLSVTSEKAKKWPEFYLFFSLHCGHCSKVMANLAINNPRDYKWYLLPLDHRPQDMQKLAHLYNLASKSQNLFRDILKFESQEEVEPIVVSEEIDRKVTNARQYFRINRYKGVPLLIVRERPDITLILVGEKRILGYFKQRGILKKYIVFPEDMSDESDK
jgi:hypothetical protein